MYCKDTFSKPVQVVDYGDTTFRLPLRDAEYHRAQVSLQSSHTRNTTRDIRTVFFATLLGHILLLNPPNSFNLWAEGRTILSV